MQAIGRGKRPFAAQGGLLLRWALGESIASTSSRGAAAFEQDRLVAALATACRGMAASAAELLGTFSCRAAIPECFLEPRLLSLSLVGRSDPRLRMGRERGGSDRDKGDVLRDQRLGKPLPLSWRDTMQRCFAFHYHVPPSDVAAPWAAEEWYVRVRSAQCQQQQEPVSITSLLQLDEEVEKPERGSLREDESIAPESTLYLLSAAANLPHPDKQYKGGEDAHFIEAGGKTGCTAVGVFDGVGGWAEIGIDAGIYARELSWNTLLALQAEPSGAPDPRRALARAHQRTKSQGSSTACVLTLSADNRIQAANLGDSGFVVIREGRLVFRSPSQQHQFNFPYQLGSGGSGGPEQAEAFQVPVFPGDVLVLGTDGLFDNVFENELVGVVMAAKRAGRAPAETAAQVAALARVRAQDKYRHSPFSRAAQEAGLMYFGGKLDDITVVVSYVREKERDGLLQKSPT